MTKTEFFALCLDWSDAPDGQLAIESTDFSVLLLAQQSGGRLQTAKRVYTPSRSDTADHRRELIRHTHARFRAWLAEFETEREFIAARLGRVAPGQQVAASARTYRITPLAWQVTESTMVSGLAYAPVELGTVAVLDVAWQSAGTQLTWRLKIDGIYLATGAVRICFSLAQAMLIAENAYRAWLARVLTIVEDAATAPEIPSHNRELDLAGLNCGQRREKQ